MNNFSNRTWHGDGRSPSTGKNMVNSFIGVTVGVISLDGVALPGTLLCKLLEISEKGFLLRVKEPRGVWGYPYGVVIFASSCSFRAATIKEEEDTSGLDSND